MLNVGSQGSKYSSGVGIWSRKGWFASKNCPRGWPPLKRVRALVRMQQQRASLVRLPDKILRSCFILSAFQFCVILPMECSTGARVHSSRAFCPCSTGLPSMLFRPNRARMLGALGKMASPSKSYEFTSRLLSRSAGDPATLHKLKEAENENLKLQIELAKLKG